MTSSSSSSVNSAQQDRHAEEAAHRRVGRREADRARILRKVVQPQRVCLANQHPEDAASARQGADGPVRLRVDAVRHEPLELEAACGDHAERRVAGASQLGGRLHEPLQERVQRQLGGDGQTGREERAQPPFADGKSVHPASLTLSRSRE
jgi:hypothetical protein